MSADVRPDREPRRTCELCGLILETNPTGRARRFCSQAHQIRAWRLAHDEAYRRRANERRAARHKPRRATTCLVCGAPVHQPDRGPAKLYCGPRCRSRAYRMRQGDRARLLQREARRRLRARQRGAT